MSDDRGDENNDAQYSEITVGPTDLQASIEGLTNGETYEIRVAGYTKAGVGVVSEPVYARPGDSYSSIYYCGLTLVRDLLLATCIACFLSLKNIHFIGQRINFCETMFCR